MNFEAIVQAMNKGDWDQVASVLIQAAQSLKAGGADFFVMSSNTVHKVAEEIKASVSIPFISITDEVAKYLSEKGIQKAGLLGTQFALDSNIYEKSTRKYGLELIKSGDVEKHEINRIIFEELVHGNILESSVKQAIETAGNLKKAGAETIILGCTELPLLLTSNNSPLPLADSTKIHTDAILSGILKP